MWYLISWHDWPVECFVFSKIPQLAEVLNLRMLLVIDNWRKSLYVGDNEFKATVTGENSSCPVNPDNCLPEPFKEQITSQINAVLQMEHPVYKLMCESCLFLW